MFLFYPYQARFGHAGWQVYDPQRKYKQCIEAVLDPKSEDGRCWTTKHKKWPRKQSLLKPDAEAADL